MTFNHISRVAFTLAAALLIGSCSSEPEDPFSEEAVRRDLDERTVAELYEAAEGQSYTPPAHGRISREQMQTYLRVTRLADTIVDVASKRVSDRADEAAKETDQFARMATTFSAFGSARAAGTADLRAALTLGVNPHEFFWIDRRVGAALHVVKERAKLEKAVEKAVEKAGGDARRSKYARDDLKSWKTRLADADAANAKLVEPHRETLATRFAF